MRQKAKLPPGWKNCLNCMTAFKPSDHPRNRQENQKFCKANCRKEFWKHGGVSVHRLKVHVRAWVERWLAELLPKLIEREITKLKPDTLRAKARYIEETIAKERGLL